MIEVVRQRLPSREETISEPIGIALARDMVMTAHDIIERMDGRRMTEAERRDTLADAFDLAYYVTGEPWHLDADAIEYRSRVIANVVG
jgi:hypothetical protein